MKIKRLDVLRLLKRILGGSAHEPKATSATIVGCGSVGGHVAIGLAKCGVNDFLLVDKEWLTPENIPRHICGMKMASLGLTKVEAVGLRMREHVPEVKCATLFGDVLQAMQAQTKEFLMRKFLIVCVGTYESERRISDVVHNSPEGPHTVFLWVEPYCVAGHMLYMHPHTGGCFRCCFEEDASFAYAVARQDERLSKRESGCQGTFTPYGSLDAEIFTSIACKEILKMMNGNVPNQSTLYTWLGDIQQFQDLGYKPAFFRHTIHTA